jgi:hypothetical protein
MRNVSHVYEFYYLFYLYIPIIQAHLTIMYFSITSLQVAYFTYTYLAQLHLHVKKKAVPSQVWTGP